MSPKKRDEVDTVEDAVEVEEETVEETVVVHDYDPVRPHSRRRNDPDDTPDWVEQEHPEVDE